MCRLLFNSCDDTKHVLLFRDVHPSKVSYPSGVYNNSIFSIDKESGGTNLLLSFVNKSICGIINDSRLPKQPGNISRGTIPGLIKDLHFLEVRRNRGNYAGCSIFFITGNTFSIYNTIDDSIKSIPENELYRLSTSEGVNSILFGDIDRIITDKHYRQQSLLNTDESITRTITEIITNQNLTNFHWKELHIDTDITYTDYIRTNESNYFRSRRILWEGA